MSSQPFVRGSRALICVTVGACRTATVLLTLLLVSALVAPATATNYTWIDPNDDHLWGSNGNWSPTGIPNDFLDWAIFGDDPFFHWADLGGVTRQVNTVRFTNTFGNYNLTNGTLSVFRIEVNSGIYQNSITANITPLGFDFPVAFGTDGVLAIQGTISGTASLTKSGAGRLFLSSVNNSFSGGVFIQGGTLQSQGPLQNSGVNSALGTGPISISGGGELYLFSGGSTNRSVTLGAGGGMITSYLNASISGLASGAGSLTKTDDGTLTLGNTANSFSGGLIVQDGRVQGAVIADAGVNSSFGTGSFTLTNGGIEYTGPTASTNRSVSASGTISGGEIRVTDPATVLSWNGVASGSYLHKSGPGTLVLGNSSNSVGQVLYIDEGTVRGATIADSGVNSSLGAGLNVAIADGGVLSYTGVSTSTNRSISLSRVAPVVTDPTIEVVNAETTLTLAGVVIGSGGLVKSGPGFLILASASSSFSGGLTIQEGRVTGSTIANSSVSSAFGRGGFSISGGGIMAYSGATAASDRTVSLGTGGGAIDVTTAGTNLTISGAVTGAGGLTKLGDGTLNLTGPNTYSGGTTISAGVLRGTTGGLQGNINNNASLIFDQAFTGAYSGVISGPGSLIKEGAGTVVLSGANVHTGGTTVAAGILQIDSDSLQGDITVNATLEVAQDVTGTLNNSVAGAGMLTKSGSGAVMLGDSGNSFAGGVSAVGGKLSGAVIADGGVNSSFGSGGQFDVSNNATLAYTGPTGASNRNVSLGAGGGGIEVADPAATLDVGGVVSGDGMLTKTGPGTLALSGSNAYTGGTTFDEGTLRISADANLGATPSSPAVNLTFDGGTLASGGVVSLSPNRWVQLQAAGGTVDVAGGATLNIPGRIDGPGTLTKTGPGTLAIVGYTYNTYSGGTVVDDGVLNVAWDSDLGAWPVVPTVNLTLDGGTLQTQTFVALHPNRTLRVEATGGTIDVAAGGTLYVLGNVEGPGTLTKTGPGTLYLNGNGGAAIIDAGALGGTGDVAGGVTVNPGGHLAPGNSPGTLTVGSLSMVSGAALDIELAGTANGQYDRLVVAGNAALGGTLNASLVGGFMPALGNQFTVLTFGSRAGDFDSYTGTDIGGFLELRPQFTATALILEARPAIEGDINLDGTVDIFDVNDVSAHWSQSGPSGDANGDGTVDIFDVNLISSNWGASGGGGSVATGSASTTAPEPSSLVLLLAGLVAAAGTFRRARVRA